MTGHACYQAETLGYVDKDHFPFIYKYIEKLKSRQAFDKAINLIVVLVFYSLNAKKRN